MTTGCMWCGEPLNEEERTRPIHGHFECSTNAALDGTIHYAGMTFRDSARHSILMMLKNGHGVDIVHALPERQRQRFRPSDYKTLPAERKREIDSLLGIGAL